MKKTRKASPQKRTRQKPTIDGPGSGSSAGPNPPNNWLRYCPARDYCFDAGRGTYWIKNHDGEWIMLNETQFKRELRQGGVSPHVPKNLHVSPLDEVLLGIQHSQNVRYAGPLAGYKSGIREMCGRRILVTESSSLIDPQPGDWLVLRTVIEGMLCNEKDRELNQAHYLYGWLKIALEALRMGQPRLGQALVLVGPHNCGKSLLQNLFTILFGDRSARPYQVMTGLTPFNSDLFEAEHLMIEDETASSDIRARRCFGAQIKIITANDRKRCHAKHRVAVELMPFWRLSISVNDEPENLMVLPPIDDSMEDKLIILRGAKKPMPMPTKREKERSAFWKTLVKELPAFVYFLENWQIPSEIESGRYGIVHFHHPEILQAIDALSPESRLLWLIDNYVLPYREDPFEDWKGTAEGLERILTSDQSDCRVQARQLLNWNTACGVYLARLAKKYPGRFAMHRIKTIRQWTVKPLLEKAATMEG